MRLDRYSIEIRSGKVLLCDPVVIGSSTAEIIDDGACFQLWRGNGEFKVYTDDCSFFIDVDPLILKAATRTQLRRVPGVVGIDSTQIGIFDLTTERLAAADDAIADGWAIILEKLHPGTYVAWFEEKGTAKGPFRGVVGFGHAVVMLLNGDTAEQIQSLEDQVAHSLRLKGPEKQAAFRSIAEALLQLHSDGSTDQRIRMLADAIKLKLPRRPRK